MRLMGAPFFHLDAAHFKLLREDWDELTGQYGATHEQINRAFQLLAEKYTEKDRAYHNLSHVSALLALSNSIKQKLTDPNAVAFAIWFHDAVYNTRRTDNEEKSAELAASVLERLRVPGEAISLVQGMIIATKEHSLEIGSDDVKAFLDLDLAILGAVPAVYREYAKAIRREYRWVPAFIYRRGRRQILERFLKRESVYFTQEMNARFECQARLNIENELGELCK
jgi:predicted metal-dependent HD superfamily phosphohydrolase